MRKRRGFCNHYRAMSEHSTCEAGVDYETLKGVPFDQRPCFFKGDPPTEKSALCELALYPTGQSITPCVPGAPRFHGPPQAATIAARAFANPSNRFAISASRSTNSCGGMRQRKDPAVFASRF